jgi:phenylacetate-CoA ligase
MDIRVEMRDESDYEETREVAMKRLAKLVKDKIGISASVVVCPLSHLERSTGKARRVIDQRPKD